jgi:hypothetical protein
MGRRAIGLCEECCDPCGLVSSLPATIYVTLGGIAGCGCQASGFGSASVNASGMSGKIAMTQATTNSWESTIQTTSPVVLTEYTDGACATQADQINYNWTVQVVFAPELNSMMVPTGNCLMVITATSAVGGFSYSGVVTPATLFSSVNNGNVCSAGGISMGGGTAVLSLS